MGFRHLTPLSSFEIPALACLSPVLTSRNTGEEDFFDAIKVAALCLGSFFLVAGVSCSAWLLRAPTLARVLQSCVALKKK